MAIITIPKKKTSSPIVKEKRKAGTRAGLTKAAIVAAAAKLIESVGANGFSLRKLAKALGVGSTTIHFHFEGGVGAVFSAVAQQALAGVTRPFKPKGDTERYLWFKSIFLHQVHQRSSRPGHTVLPIAEAKLRNATASCRSA